MANWRVAKSLEVLRKQLNEAFPNRSKVSDGSIGDAAHSSRKSDHNPNAQGIVCARDFTHDPKNGIDCQWLANTLLKNKDPRIKYVIWNHRMFSSIVQPWKWRAYSGVNAHTHHLHVSVAGNVDDGTKWELDTEDDVAKVVPPPVKPDTSAPATDAPATDTEVTATSVTSKTTVTEQTDSAGTTATTTQETPSIGTRLKTSTTFVQSLGINIVAAATGLVAFFKENKEVMIGAGVVLVLIFAIYSWRESKRVK